MNRRSCFTQLYVRKYIDCFLKNLLSFFKQIRFTRFEIYVFFNRFHI